MQFALKCKARRHVKIGPMKYSLQNLLVIVVAALVVALFFGYALSVAIELAQRDAEMDKLPKVSKP